MRLDVTFAVIGAVGLTVGLAVGFMFDVGAWIGRAL
jgi:hypothetical protein